MGAGKVVVGGHGPSRIVCNENGPCCGTTVAHSVDGIEERIWFNVTCPKLHQFERLLGDVVYTGICYGISPPICLVGRKKIKN